MSDKDFIKHRKSFVVAKHALADVIEALSNDDEHYVKIVVTKEDNELVVFFNREYRSRSNGLPECCDGTESNK